MLDNGILIEIKGYFTATDRKKHLLVKEQNPELDIRFVFGNSKNRIHKNLKQLMLTGVIKTILNTLINLSQLNG